MKPSALRIERMLAKVEAAATGQTLRARGPATMKPSALRIERLLAKVEAELARSARPRRYCFYFDEEAEAERKACPTSSYPGF
jgi:hypothetical protein